jgi:hypothetical protein
MEDKDYKMTEEQIAMKLAEKLYENFFNELMTALRNSVKNFENARWSTFDGNAISYYQGKMHAFKEISERLEKEYNLILNNQINYDSVCYKMIDEIKYRTDKELDTVFPDNKYRGTRFGHIFMFLKGKLANLLEGYFSEGFRLGVIFEKNNKKETEKFDPVSFEKLCNETFIGEKYINAVRYIEDPKYRAEVDLKRILKD